MVLVVDLHPVLGPFADSELRDTGEYAPVTIEVGWLQAQHSIHHITSFTVH
jgi:hypothetical protein